MLEARPEINFENQFSVQNKTYNLYSTSEGNKYLCCCIQASSSRHSQPYHTTTQYISKPILHNHNYIQESTKKYLHMNMHKNNKSFHFNTNPFDCIGSFCLTTLMGGLFTPLNLSRILYAWSTCTVCTVQYKKSEIKYQIHRFILY